MAGYRVTGKPRARGKKVTLQVAERPGCDVGAAPKVSFKGRGLKSGGRSVPRSKIDMERRNRSFPRITCAVTADRDGNGRLDTLALTYSKKVSNRPVAAGGGPFSVEGYSVASVGRARGRLIELRVRERGAPDTGARPAILYKRPSGKAVYAVRSGRTQAFSGNFKAVRDRIAPKMVSARTLDTDADGSLDGLSAGWTEPVSESGGFAVAGANVTAIRASQQSVDLNINEGAHSTGARPNLSYGGELRARRQRQPGGGGLNHPRRRRCTGPALRQDGRPRRLRGTGGHRERGLLGDRVARRRLRRRLPLRSQRLRPGCSWQRLRLDRRPKSQRGSGPRHGRAPSRGVHTRSGDTRARRCRQRGRGPRLPRHHRRGSTPPALRNDARTTT